jgi:hypothetical protein
VEQVGLVGGGESGVDQADEVDTVAVGVCLAGGGPAVLSLDDGEGSVAAVGDVDDAEEFWIELGDHLGDSVIVEGPLIGVVDKEMPGRDGSDVHALLGSGFAVEAGENRVDRGVEGWCVHVTLLWVDGRFAQWWVRAVRWCFLSGTVCGSDVG